MIPVAVVTGAGRGICQAIALALAEQGYTVVIASLTQTELDNTAREIERQGGRCIAVAADLAREADLKRIIGAARGAGQINVLVNNAGVCPELRDGRRTPVTEITTQEWNDVMMVNLTSAFVLTRDIGKLMCEAKPGSIVTIAPVTVRIGALTAGARYVASKAGMVGLTKSTVREFAPHGVRVNAVAHGRIATGMTRVANNALGPGWVQRNVPLGREGDGHEITDVVCFLVLAKSSYITGSTIDVTGGWTMT